MFVVLIHFTKPLEIIDQHLADHRHFLSEGYKKNYFVVSGPRIPRTGGVIVSQLKDRDQLEKIMHDDPYYVRGVAEYEIIEFDPVKYHENFVGFLQ